MIDTKKVGRPKKFDRTEAIEQALQVFWTKGFDGASMKMLTDAMGINSPSLYAEFGDKRGLYLEAIDRYANHGGCAPLDALEAAPNIQDAVHGFFEAVIAHSSGEGAQGCFLVSCVSTSAGNVDGTSELLHDAISDTDDRIAARFEKAIAEGQLPSDFPARRQAQLLFDLRQGLVFRARAGVSAAQLREDIDHRVSAVLRR